jgi:hypothetical protein
MIVAYLGLKGLSARAIHEKLTAALRREAVAYSSVTGYFRQVHPLPSTWDVPSSDVHKGIDDADQALLSALDATPFASVR